MAYCYRSRCAGDREIREHPEKDYESPQWYFCWYFLGVGDRDRQTDREAKGGSMKVLGKR